MSVKIRRVFGIDPGLIHTGWAVIDVEGSRRVYVASGVILPKAKDELSNRLLVIFNSVRELIRQYAPDEVAIEYTFVNKNPTTTLILGHARAAGMLAAAVEGKPVFEYEPNLIKKTIVGYGHADKDQVLRMINLLLPKALPKTADEADAIAIALTRAAF